MRREREFTHYGKWITRITVFLWSVVALPAFAAEEAVEGFWRAEVWWFPLLEVGGTLVALVAFFTIQRASKGVGGAVGQAFAFVKFAALLFLFGFVLRAFFEIRGLEGFTYDLLFELPVYVGVVLVALGARKFGDLSKT